MVLVCSDGMLLYHRHTQVSTCGLMGTGQGRQQRCMLVCVGFFSRLFYHLVLLEVFSLHVRTHVRWLEKLGTRDWNREDG